MTPGSRFGDDRRDDSVENLRGALDPGDFFGAFDRTGLLQELGGVLKARFGKRRAHFVEHARHDGPFRRAQQTAQAAHADARALQLQLLHPFDHGLAPGAPPRAYVGYPILGDAPPFHLVAAADEGGHLAGERKYDRDFGLMAADVGQIANVRLKLIPVALIGKTDDRVELLSAA